MNIKNYVCITCFLFYGCMCSVTLKRNETHYLFKSSQPASLVEMINSFNDDVDIDEKWQQRNDVRDALKQHNFSDKERFLAATLAITKHRREIASLLLAEGFNVHAKAENVQLLERGRKLIACEWSPLCFALLEKDSQAIQMLVKHGASIRNMESNEGFFPYLEKKMTVQERDQLLGLVNMVEQEKQEVAFDLDGLDDLGQ